MLFSQQSYLCEDWWGAILVIYDDGGYQYAY